ncbi:MAG: hypothetical protein ABEJ83_05370 [Candidatus Nanohaloarchaea archaeon]
MTYIYHLAGENLELAEAELEGFLKSQNIQEQPERKNKLAFTQKHPSQLKRLALTHEVAEKITETDYKTLDITYTPEKSYSVRTVQIKGKNDSERIQRQLGENLSSEENHVDLESPEKEIKAYLFEDSVVLGRVIEDIDRGLYQQRANQNRPFSSPVSLDPVLARTLVNLSEVSAGEKILDPFCGTGGILIEAGLCGVMPVGADAKQEMIKGTRQNLEEYGIMNHEINQEKIRDQGFEGADAVVTDLPYGKASKMEGEPVKQFLEKIEDFEGKTVFMYNEPELGGYEADYEIYVHKSLTRYVYKL